MEPLKITLRYVFRVKVCTDFHGPGPLRFETLSIVAPNFDDCLVFLHNLYKREDSLYSYEILDKTECVVL